MGGAACAAKILLCSPPVANRVSEEMRKATAVAETSLMWGYISEENLTALQYAVCRCESLAEQIAKELRGPLQACMNDVAVCPVRAPDFGGMTEEQLASLIANSQKAP